jgi:hypothetical protein
MSKNPILTVVGRLLASLAIVSMLLVSPTSSSAQNGKVATFTFKGKDVVFTFPADVCGAVYSVTETVNFVDHITDDLSTPNPLDHFTHTENGQVTLVPEDPSLPTYTGRVTFWVGGNSNPNSEGVTFTLNLNLEGSDGSSLKVHETFHLTIVDGNLVREFDKITCNES